MGGDREPVQGGFILLSRKLLKSGIMEKPPLYLKLWIWMLMQASFKNHGNLKRGQFFTSYKKMQKAMAFKVGYRTAKPTKREIEWATKYFTNVHAIVTMKVLHGMVITILNYDYYQSIGNYECANECDDNCANDVLIKRKKGIKKERTNSCDKNPCPFDDILDLYHTILAELPRVQKLTERRQKILSARWNEKAKSERGLRSNTLEFWEGFFKYISQSDFLMGRKKDWRANFEWIITKKNFHNIIEGIYHSG